MKGINMNLKDLEQLKELVSVAKLLKPIISESADELLDAYGPEIEKLMKRVRISIVSETHEAIQQYVELGYDEKTAVLLVLNTKHALTEAINRKGK